MRILQRAFLDIKLQRAMENFTTGVSLQSSHEQTMSHANSSQTPSVSSSNTSSSSSSSASSRSSSISSSSSSLTTSSSMTFFTHSSTSPSSAASTSSTAALLSSESEHSSILTSPVSSDWNNSSTPYSFTTDNSTLKDEQGFPAGAIAGIVVGGFVFLVIVIIIVVCLCRNCGRSEKCLKSNANNRQMYEVSQPSSKASSTKKNRNVNDYFSESFKSRGETMRIEEVVVTSSQLNNNEDVARCSESAIDPDPPSEVLPPPVPRRDVTSGRSASQQSPQPFSSSLPFASPLVAANGPESENGSATVLVESFPDELPPPPPRDSVYVIDS